MKIAFVGKGGSGKTTVSSLFAHHLSTTRPVLGIDADINMHMAELFSVQVDRRRVISEKKPSEQIRTYLRGTNHRIASNDHFKKSTPPGQGSNLITISHPDDWFMHAFTQKVSPHLSLAVVGTYAEEGIASSCYHNNLAVLENILSHTTDDGTVVVDMVAGTDAFASTLFAQFDALFFVAEPTTRSLAVYKQYENLAEKGGVADRLFVVGNKVENEADQAFIRAVVGEKLVTSLSRSQHILDIDKGRSRLDTDKLDAADRQALDALQKTAQLTYHSAQERLPLLWRLHTIYVSQPYIKDRFGDLTGQIDRSFTYPSSL